jgi:hypothetical protein
VLHQQATTEFEQGLAVAIGQLIEDGPPGGIGKGLEDVQSDSIGKYLLACQARSRRRLGRDHDLPMLSSAQWTPERSR